MKNDRRPTKQKRKETNEKSNGTFYGIFPRIITLHARVQFGFLQSFFSRWHSLCTKSQLSITWTNATTSLMIFKFVNIHRHGNVFETSTTQLLLLIFFCLLFSFGIFVWRLCSVHAFFSRFNEQNKRLPNYVRFRFWFSSMNFPLHNSLFIRHKIKT